MKETPQRVLLDISWESLLKIVGLCLGLWVAYYLRDILVMLFVIFIFVAALNPTVSRLQQYMSRVLAVAVVYFVLAMVLVLVVSGILPTLFRQVNDLARNVPQIADRVRPLVETMPFGQYPGVVDRAINGLVGSLNRLSANLLQTGFNIIGGLTTAVTGIVISFYLLLEERNAREFFHQLLPQHRFEAVYSTVSKISERMGGWVRGQLILMLIVGAANFIGYLVLGLPTPLPLAIWAGLTEAIPVIGPILGIIPAVGVALTTGSLIKAVLVVALGLAIQQLEANVLVPRVMRRAVGLSPVLVILALLIGAKLFGFVGAIVAVPAAAAISVIVGEWPNLRKIWES